MRRSPGARVWPRWPRWRTLNRRRKFSSVPRQDVELTHITLIGWMCVSPMSISFVQQINSALTISTSALTINTKLKPHLWLQVYTCKCSKCLYIFSARFDTTIYSVITCFAKYSIETKWVATGSWILFVV